MERSFASTVGATMSGSRVFLRSLECSEKNGLGQQERFSLLLER